MNETEKKPKPKETGGSKPPFERKTFTNDLGIPQVVLVPSTETDLKKGIPLSLDLSPLYGHMPKGFQTALYKALHAQGLVEPGDYFKKGAAERYQRALRDVLKHDFLNIQALAKEEINHAR